MSAPARKHPARPCAPARIGKRIAQRRKALGETQAGLARKAGMTRQNLWKIETGRASRIDAAVIDRLARALKTPAGWFFEGGPQPRGGLGANTWTAEEWALARRVASLDPPHRKALSTLLSLAEGQFA
ncbi:helix-turn-helix transcriptional regulator [Glycocaulis profundi]|nr:helix-turn-helix transcriptional regulator [Glycocaulis profundi]